MCTFSTQGFELATFRLLITPELTNGRYQWAFPDIREHSYQETPTIVVCNYTILTWLGAEKVAHAPEVAAADSSSPTAKKSVFEFVNHDDFLSNAFRGGTWRVSISI